MFNEQNQAWSQTEISRALGLNMTSTYRFINTLVQLGYLKKDKAGKKLRLGVRALALGSNLVRTMDLPRIIRSLVDEVHDRHNITVDVALVIDEALTIVYRREAEDALIHRLPAISRAWHATSLGKAYLAFLSDEDRDARAAELNLEARTPKTIVDRVALAAELKKTRERGFSVANEEFLPGLITIGAPLINLDTGFSMGAVSFDFSTIQQTAAGLVEDYSRLIVDLAEALSQAISAT
ncbi:MAG: IclR family transcriptional regulator [Pseudomonadota bacterium]